MSLKHVSGAAETGERGEEMRVLVCGDRNWTDKSLIHEHLSSITNLELVIEGAARGADRLAGQVASEMGVPVQEFPADWDTFGKAAGPIRNRKMLDLKPDLVVAFYSDISKSKGTKDCIFEANRRGIEVRLLAENKEE